MKHRGGNMASIGKESYFVEQDLPLDLGSGEQLLQSTRLEADSVWKAWYELYLVATASGYLIEKHSGSAQRPGWHKETWFRRTLPDAKRKYTQILNGKLNPTRHSPRKYKVVVQ